MLSDLNKTFSENPVMLDMHRSTFSIGQTHKTTMYEGDLVPVFLREVLPGDTFSVDTSMLIRMATPIFPVMDNAFIDLYFFYVPNRIVWNHWKEFMGENTSAPWSQNITYTVPQISFGQQFSSAGVEFTKYHETSDGRMVGPSPNHVMNYFGIPTSIYPRPINTPLGAQNYPYISVSDLPNRAYRLIWNEFFRDQNVQAPVPFYNDDSTREYNASSDPLYNYGGPPLKVNKFHDYFTSCLPSPQKASSVVSLAYPQRFIPVHTMKDRLDFGYAYPNAGDAVPLSFSNGVYNTLPTIPRWEWSQTSAGGAFKGVALNGNGVSTTDDFNASEQSGVYLTPDNLYADFAGANFTNVSVLRQAFAIQRLYEAFARGGTRYREMLKSIFGVTSPDARVQVPEYLGGDRIPINMDQVLQTSATDNVSPQGNTAGYSLTTNVQHSFTKSFVEHGMVIGLACIRVEHTYCQGIEPYWFRKNMFDFYFPQFANLSEQPVYKKYICATGFKEYDDSVFGYQEAWADYRYTPNRLSGSFSPICYDATDSTLMTPDPDVVISNSSLADAWTYNDFYALKAKASHDEPDYSDCPTLSADWMKEASVNIGQTLVVENEPQFICDFRFTGSATRPMPVRSIPGLIDHH